VDHLRVRACVRQSVAAARALQGAFAALLAPAALSLLATAFTDPAERGKAFGVYGAIAGTGGAFGLLLGGFLTEVLEGYTTAFWWAAATFAVGALITGSLLRSGARPEMAHSPAEPVAA
jgi:MFS family permease